MSTMRFVIILLSLIFVCTHPLSAQSLPSRVSSVAIEGTKRIDTDTLIDELTTKATSVSKQAISEDVKTLYRTGFFDRVRAELRGDGATKRLVFVVAEKPLVRRMFTSGNEAIGDDQIFEVLQIGSGQFLDKQKINAFSEQLRVFYQSKGYYDATVEHSVVPIADNQVDLTFKLDEGERYKVRDIYVTGLTTIDESDITDQIETSEYSWWRSWLTGSGRLNEAILANDRTLIRQYLLDNGFVEAKVSEALVEKDDNGLSVTFDVVENGKFSIGAVSVSGDLIDDDTKKTLEDIKSGEGETFNASLLREDSFTVSSKFTDIGYAYANVVPETSVNPVNETVDIRFVVNKGDPVTVDTIDITGNTKTYDRVIRRELEIEEQQIFSSSKVDRSRILLERTGLFDEVNIATEAKDDSDKIDLKVNVREASTGTVSAGAGFSTANGAIINARLSENNVFGTGRQLDFNADLGDQRNDLILSLTDPRINDTRWSGSLDAFIRTREFPDFNRGQQGAAFGVGYPLENAFGEWAQDMRFYNRYQYSQIEITDVDENDAAPLVIQEQGTSTISSLTPRLTRNTLNNRFNPTNGSRQNVSVEIAGLGGDEDFYLFEANNSWFYPLFKTEFGEFTFSLRTRLGYGETSGGDNLPLARRYFPGGINSVRGFDNRTLGPTDENGNEFGGSKQFVNNAEIIFPLVESAGLRGVIFYDHGQAFDDEASIDFGELREAYGYGIRWNSPLGPIRVEFGFPVDPIGDEDSMVTLFSVGAPL